MCVFLHLSELHPFLMVSPPLGYMVHPLRIMPGYTSAVNSTRICGCGVLGVAVIGKGDFSPSLLWVEQSKSNQQQQTQRMAKRANSQTEDNTD